MDIVRKNPEIFIPLYLQIKEKIINDILQRKLRKNDRFFSETELCKKYDVSRITVRRSIAELVEENILYKIPAKGTFVSDEIEEKAFLPALEKEISIIVPDIDEYAVSTICSGVKQEADEKNYRSAIYTSGRNIEKECQEINRLKQTNCRGAIIFPNWGKVNAEQIFELKRQKFNFVLVDRFFREIDTDYVVVDNKKGAFLAVSHLIELGHTRIAHIAWPAHTAGTDRLEGYKDALIKNKLLIEDDLIILLDFSKFARLNIEPESGGYEETKKLLSLNPRPTAIFTASDPVAFEALRAIREAGLKVPEDISIVGFDDLKFSALLDTPLTTVAQPFREIGKTAMRILADKIEGKSKEIRQVVLEPKLIVRNSTASV
ncbi:MAG: GntR family transcriptional regulator [Victivallales bacterium]